MPSVPRAMVRVFVPVAVAAGVAFAFFLPSCNTGAVGISACQTMEAARCNAMSSCGKPAAWITECTEYYRDQCLVGIQNISSAAPNDTQINACITAMNATAACAKNNTPIATCPNAALVPNASALALPGTLTPCNILAGSVSNATAGAASMGAELLFQCAFVVQPADAGTDADAASADADADTADADAAD